MASMHAERKNSRVQILFPFSESGVYNEGQTAFRDQYFADERRWVMEALPFMDADEWIEYTKWVKNVLTPLELKLK